MTIAIIGAGVAGLTAARRLVQAGKSVQLFDKARGPGGRLASRRRESSTIDHGTVGFTAIDAAFIDELAAAADAGVATQWQPVFAQNTDSGHASDEDSFAIALTAGDPVQWLGTPRMSALTRYWSQGLTVIATTRIAQLTGSAGHWALVDEAGERHLDGNGEAFEQVLLSIPAPQAADILASIADEQVKSVSDQWLQQARLAQPLPVWALMLEFEQDPLVQVFALARL